MFRFTNCSFCGKTIMDEEYAMMQDQRRGGCDCSGYRQSRYCQKSGCSARKDGSGKYCSRHKDCCQYDEGYSGCQEKEVSGGYCNYHSEKCNHYSCSKREGLIKKHCRNHRCRDYTCNEPVSNSGSYCSQHVKECQLKDCDKRFNDSNNKYCPDHHEKCQAEEIHYSKCSREILKRVDGGYCFYHKKKCGAPLSQGCQWRISNSEEFCREHIKKCEFESCNKRTDDYRKHCPQHPREKQIEEYKRQLDSLRTQLNATNIQLTTKRQEVNWLKNRLKMEMRDEEYQARVEADYPPQFRN